MAEANNIPIEDFQTALLQIDQVKAAEIFENIYKEDRNLETLEQLITGALEKIGVGWEDGQLSLSQVYMSGVICERLIEKNIRESNASYKKNPKMAIAVLQDHHALGKRIIHSALRASGYDLIDFGQGLSVEEIVEKTVEADLEFLLISTLMLPSALKVKNVIESLRKKGSSVKVIVGGAPFRLDSSLWKKVNADADGKNGTEVKKIIENWKEDNNHELDGTCHDGS